MAMANTFIKIVCWANAKWGNSSDNLMNENTMRMGMGKRFVIGALFMSFESGLKLVITFDHENRANSWSMLDLSRFQSSLRFALANKHQLTCRVSFETLQGDWKTFWSCISAKRCLINFKPPRHFLTVCKPTSHASIYFFESVVEMLMSFLLDVQ